jgi:hypothetical protein
MLTVMGMVGGAMVSSSGQDSLYSGILKIKNGQDPTGQGFANTLVRETIGYDMGQKKWYVPSFTALTIGGAVASKVANRFVKPTTFDAIPWVGKKIKL